MLVAVLRDRNALDQFHHEVRPAGVGHPAVEDLGDVRVVHDGQGLPLGLEAGDDLAGVHPGLQHLQGHLAADRLGLLGQEHDAEPALANLFQQLVRADDVPGTFADRLVNRRGQGRPLSVVPASRTFAIFG